MPKLLETHKYGYLGNEVVVDIDVIPKIISMVCDLGRKSLPSLRLSFVMHNIGQ